MLAESVSFEKRRHAEISAAALAVERFQTARGKLNLFLPCYLRRRSRDDDSPKIAKLYCGYPWTLRIKNMVNKYWRPVEELNYKLKNLRNYSYRNELGVLDGLLP